ncbi:MAG: hypothetical protein ACXACG_15960 [Candidatus Thorarchaeota archaeon]|jgi:hypothetical protein
MAKRKKKSSAMRTKKGNVTAKARKKSGGKGGKYPIFDQTSALNAIKLRHHSTTVSASSVLSRASRWASANNNTRVKTAVKNARERDRKRKKK